MAHTYTLVALETASIQQYIFGSNRLRENVGASFLVDAATGQWALEVIAQVTKGACNVDSAHELVTDSPTGIEDPASDWQAEVLYAGGGNVVALFKEAETAKAFGRALSRRVLTDAPGLHLVLASMQFTWYEAGDAIPNNALSLSEAERHLRRTVLRNARNQQPRYTEILGQGVTVEGDSLSLPAVHVGPDRDNPDRLARVSAEVRAKQFQTTEDSKANLRLRDAIGLSCHYEFPFQLDDMGRSSNEMSFMAVVHADGNGIGNLFKKIGNQYKKHEDNRAFIHAKRDLSEKSKDVYNHAIQAALIDLQEWADGDGQLYGYNEQATLKMEMHGKKWVLPFRPIISGGDDITFVCDGRIGLALAQRVVEEFEDRSEKLLGTKLTACAGVAIVNVHYPFARAYALAEDLCDSAKQLTKKATDSTVSAIDWHIAKGGLFADLDTMRERDYSLSHGMLTMRPVLLPNQPADQRTWALVESMTLHFQTTKWAEHRSKAKDLMDALRNGPAATEHFQQRYLLDLKLELPAVDNEQAERRGWRQGYCLYYDALELMDLHVPLPKK